MLSPSPRPCSSWSRPLPLILPQHVFWPDEISYDASMMADVIGHRQVADAYLVELASYFGGSLVTLDKGLVALHGPSVELIPNQTGR